MIDGKRPEPVITVKVQEVDFDIAQLQSKLLGGACAEGAITTFTGYVRHDNEDRRIDQLALEHYPGMTERSITEIAEQAAERWPLLAAHVVHRIGKLARVSRLCGWAWHQSTARLPLAPASSSWIT